jgi:uncharacterized protein (DUF433 family)
LTRFPLVGSIAIADASRSSRESPWSVPLPKLKFDLERLIQFSDPREVPTYTLGEAAHYLSIPLTTVRAWVRGTSYTQSDGSRRRFQKVIELPDRNLTLLSFYNLAEAHVLRALREIHRIDLQKIRRALDFVRRERGWERPLIQAQFRTDGVGLFIEQLGKLIDATADGQLVMSDIVSAHLDRLDWEGDLAARLYPFTRLTTDRLAPKSVLIDPTRSFGRPVLANLGVATSEIAERYKAGDSIKALMKDFGGTQTDIEEAIRCELQIAAAA